jgi:aryl-alcohol dehydrogenase-like predicted oxidoreductase
MGSMLESVCGNLRTSVLGFGCGSVMGRVGRSASLRAMNAAWDRGITLFDTARSYGFGEAEGVLGEFLQGKRDRAIVATKYGIPPQRQSAVKRMALGAARSAFKVPGVRGLVRGKGTKAAAPGQFSAVGLRESVETSLRELRTDYVDILFLHEATEAVLHDVELMSALDGLLSSGKVLRVGLYAGAEVIDAAIETAPQGISAAQYGVDPLSPLVAGFAARNHREMLLIGNHPFGSEERMGRFRSALTVAARDETVPIELREKLQEGGDQVALEALLGIGLKISGLHALVYSMMRHDHQEMNIRAVENCRFTMPELKLVQGRLLRVG